MNHAVGLGRERNLGQSRPRYGGLILAREGVRAASRQFRKWGRLVKASPKHLLQLLQEDWFLSLQWIGPTHIRPLKDFGNYPTPGMERHGYLERHWELTLPSMRLMASPPPYSACDLTVHSMLVGAINSPEG